MSGISNSKNMPSRGLLRIHGVMFTLSPRAQPEGLCNITECAAINPALAGS